MRTRTYGVKSKANSSSVICAVVSALSGNEVLYTTVGGDVIIRGTERDAELLQQARLKAARKLVSDIEDAILKEMVSLPNMSAQAKAFAQLAVHSGYVSFLISENKGDSDNA